jgi:hypothetical protein
LTRVPKKSRLPTSPTSPLPPDSNKQPTAADRIPAYMALRRRED